LGGSSTVHIYTHTVHRTTQLTITQSTDVNHANGFKLWKMQNHSSSIQDLVKVTQNNESEISLIERNSGTIQKLPIWS
jgi:hypothetical protein